VTFLLVMPFAPVKLLNIVSSWQDWNDVGELNGGKWHHQQKSHRTSPPLCVKAIEDFGGVFLICLSGLLALLQIQVGLPFAPL